MQVGTLRLGPYQTNCHLLHDDTRVWIIDPGQDGESIAEFITTQRWIPQGVILTHSHWDHILGIPGLRSAFGDLPILIHEAEASSLGREGAKRLRQLAVSIDPSQRSIPLALWEQLPEPTTLLVDGSRIDACDITVLHTPGHTPGSICLYRESEHMLFSGDTLFAGTIGRTDLPGSDPEAILVGIREKLAGLPLETVVHPGHGPSTTIGRELQFNPWL